MVELEYTSFLKTPSPISKKRFEKIAQLVAQQQKIRQATASVVLVGERRMRRLNCIYRNKDYVTNVLSFASEDMPIPGEDLHDLGDIILCVPKIKKEARVKGVSVRDEMEYLFVHSFLHLLGYDHISDRDFKKMKTVEDSIMKKI